LDSFDIDMELLRRLGELRKGVLELTGGDVAGRDRLTDAVEGARERARGGSETMEAFLDVLARGAREMDPREWCSSFPWGAAVMEGLATAEDHIFDLADQGALQRLGEVTGRLEEAVGGVDPGETQAVSSETPEGSSEEGPAFESKEVPPPPGQVTTVDHVAAFLVRMDPADRVQAARLREMLSRCAGMENQPPKVAALLQQGEELLADVTGPKRTRKAVRAEVVESVGHLLEEASFVLEEMEHPREAGAPWSETPSPTETSPIKTSEDGEAQAVEQVPDSRVDDVAKASPGSPPLPAVPSSGVGEVPDEADIPSLEPLPEGSDPGLLADFSTEGFEYLEQAEEALLALEADPGDRESVNVVFRAFHTIKGVAGFMGLGRIADLAHHAETLLSRVREGELRFTPTLADLSLRAIDVMKALLEGVRDSVEDGALRIPPAFGPVFRTLADPGLPDRLKNGEESEVADTPTSPSASSAPEASEERVLPEGEEGEALRKSSSAERSVRVRTDRLDSLVDMVGELVIAHSMIAQDPMILQDRGSLSRKVDHTAKILRELQDLSTSLRMVPLKPAFQKVARVVRDLSRKSGKPVRLITEGEDTEIDRTMVDVIADPLVHMVRNSVDHGLELPEERQAAGKPREGTIQISAHQAGGNVVIQISDDGRGLDREKILAKARERDVVESERGLADREIYQLIFAPGFSTAEKVTEVSGRGVGMDVVRRSVESLRGRVAIDTEPGLGSTFSIHLPLTLSITDGMVVRVGSQRYIIPSVKIHMSLRPEAQALSTVSGKGEMVLLHEELLPVIRLNSLWNISGSEEDITQGILVIVGEGGQRSAILVDEIVTQQQFVVKPLSGMVVGTQGVAGGAIMGNGDVGLILDPEGIIALARGQAQQAA
jgi:two-component system, chemotaxis family, sensor kinase CheA